MRTDADPGGEGREWRTAILVALLVMLAWEGLVRAGVVSALFFPPPSFVALTICRLTAGGRLLREVGATLSRLWAGFLLGAVPGACLGLAMGWSRRLRGVVDPFVAAFHPLPKTSLLPLMMIVLGLGNASKLAVIGLAAFFPVAISAMAGVRHISPIHFEVAANYGASRLGVFARVVVPGSLPMLMAGARLAFNTAIHVTIAVELLAARTGLGAMIWSAWETMRTEELYAGIVVAAALGVLFNALLGLATHALVPWQTERVV